MPSRNGGSERIWSRYVETGDDREARRVLPRVIWESWRRCREDWRLDVGLAEVTSRLPEEQWRALRERHRQCWWGGVEPLWNEAARRVGENGGVVAIFDAEGWMLDLEGDSRARTRLETIRFAPGYNWSEASAGTNGPGLALWRREPVRVRGAEHYIAAWHPWNCASAVVRDPETERIVAAVDVTAPAGSEASRSHALAVAATLARAAEAELAHRFEARRAALLDLFRGLAAGRSSEGLLAVDAGLRVLRCNDAAAVHLGPPDRPSLEHCPGLKAAVLNILERYRGPKTHPGIIGSEGDDHPSGEDQIEFERFELTECRHVGSRATRVLVAPAWRDGQLLGALLLLAGSLTRAVVQGRSTSSATIQDKTHPNMTITARRCDQDPLAMLDGQTEALVRLKDRARRAAASELPILLMGETGTGKEVLARAIHAASRRGRTGRPFVAVNCGALPESLIESELFGHAPGAFTGATARGRPGRFVEADGGTLLLDEVHDLSPSAQSALLRVLQEGEVTPLGGSTRRVDVRVIAACNRDLRAEVAAGRFRADLFYRLHVLTLELPPLRCRRDDIPHLAYLFLEEALAAREAGASGSNPIRGWTPRALEALQAYDWPGNLRELKAVVHAAVTFAEGTLLDLDDLPDFLRPESLRVVPPPGCPPAFPADSSVASPLLGRTSRTTALGRGDHAAEDVLLSANPANAEPWLRALQDAQGNLAEAARRLGVSRMTLYRRINRRGLIRIRRLQTNGPDPARDIHPQGQGHWDEYRP